MPETKTSITTPRVGIPLVSVVMAVYNGEKYLDTSIPSILNQSFRDFEFIIVNDGSVDGTVDVIQKYAKQDNRIVLINQENTGLSVALNNGVKIARGKYVARQDVDDVSLPHRLEAQVNTIEDQCLLVSGWANFDDDNETSPRLYNFLRLLPYTWRLNFLRFVNPCTHGTYFFSKEHFWKVGGYRSGFKYAQDYDLLLRFAENLKIKMIPEEI